MQDDPPFPTYDPPAVNPNTRVKQGNPPHALQSPQLRVRITAIQLTIHLFHHLFINHLYDSPLIISLKELPFSIRSTANRCVHFYYLLASRAHRLQALHLPLGDLRCLSPTEALATTVRCAIIPRQASLAYHRQRGLSIEESHSDRPRAQVESVSQRYEGGRTSHGQSMTMKKRWNQRGGRRRDWESDSERNGQWS